MNTQASNDPKRNWVRIALVVGALLLVAYFSGRPGLEKALGLEPGTLGGKTVAEKEADENETPKTSGQTSQQSENKSNAQSKTQSNRGDQARENKSDTSSNNQGANKSDSNSMPEEPKFQLRKNGFVMESPAGLTYYVGNRGENRISHVMRHAEDNLSRPVHGVFSGTEEEIFALIDEAYQLSQAKSRWVEKKVEGDRVVYSVDMRRPIGYKGGKNGKRDGNPELTVLRLVVEKGNRVITAFPYR